MKLSALIQLLPILSVAAYSDGTICNDASLTDATCKSTFTTCIQKSSECANGSSVPACRQACRINCDDCTTKAVPATAQAAYNTCMASARACADRMACITAYNNVVQQCIDLANQANAGFGRSYTATDCGSLKTVDSSGTKKDCNGQCVDTASDSNNCGGCGTKCANGSTCSNGKCMEVCPYGYYSIHYTDPYGVDRGVAGGGNVNCVNYSASSGYNLNWSVCKPSGCCVQFFENENCASPSGTIHCDNWGAVLSNNVRSWRITGCLAT